MRFLLCILACCPLATPSTPNVGEIKVLVIDDAGVPAHELRQMRHYASRIFERAHIRMQWIDDTASLPLTVDSTRVLAIRILRSPDAAVRTAGKAYIDEHGGNYATLNYSLIQQLTFAGPARPGQILAAAAAHEIGHLLLGPGRHSPYGVMRDRIGRQELIAISQQTIAFSSSESALMHQRLARPHCCADPSGSHPERR